MVGPVCAVELMTRTFPVLGQEVIEVETKVVIVTLIHLMCYPKFHCSQHKDDQMTARKGNGKLDKGKEFRRTLPLVQIF